MMAFRTRTGRKKPMKANPIHVTRCENGIATVELDDPPGNALGADSRRELLHVLGLFASDDEIRCLLLTARGEIFCGGDDLKEAQQGDRVAAIREFHTLFARLEELRCPTIAAVNGACAGGGLELALCCDVRLASSTARFIASGVNVGLVASSVRLCRLIGVARAKAMLLTGLPVSAAEALQSGLVWQILAPDAMQEAALAMAQRIASRAPLSIEAVKRITNMWLHENTGDPVLLEAEAIQRLATTRDHREAIAAFAECRQPAFVGE